MQEIIQPIDRKLLKAELTKSKMLRRTNKSNNEIYIVTAHDAPHVMQEIGRLREIAFRYYGGGTGCPVDIDEYDTMQDAYRQLIVWDPAEECILGGYRFLCGSDVRFDNAGKPILATSHMFHFSDRFVRDYLPYTVELGRSFVALEYQATRTGSARGLFVLDNLWDGLGALSVIDPRLQYYFGKVTMYNTYNTEARNMILYFLQPLVNAYMSLSPKMRVFGTAVNHEFGEVEETGILIKINEILEEKKKRHIETFLREECQNPELISRREAGE